MASQVIIRLAALATTNGIGLYYYLNHAENRGDLGTQAKTHVTVQVALAPVKDSTYLNSNTAVFRLTHSERGNPKFRQVQSDSEEVQGFIRNQQIVFCPSFRYGHPGLNGREINIKAAVVGENVSGNSCRELQKFQDELCKKEFFMRD